MYYPNKLRSGNKFISFIPPLMMVTLFAFAAIFIDISFIEYYKKGEAERIVYQLNELKLSQWM